MVLDTDNSMYYRPGGGGGEGGVGGQKQDLMVPDFQGCS